MVDGCEFTNCKFKYKRSSDDWAVLGGVIYGNAMEMDIINSSFTDCGGINKDSYYSSCFISNIKSSVDNCRFLNCWHFYQSNNKDSNNPKRTMFPANSSYTNCTFEDSAKFC
jgi:hypothetical protein